jgi:hypothetical protein
MFIVSQTNCCECERVRGFLIVLKQFYSSAYDIFTELYVPDFFQILESKVLRPVLFSACTPLTDGNNFIPSQFLSTVYAHR